MERAGGEKAGSVEYRLRLLRPGEAQRRGGKRVNQIEFNRRWSNKRAAVLFSPRSWSGEWREKWNRPSFKQPEGSW